MKEEEIPLPDLDTFTVDMVMLGKKSKQKSEKEVVEDQVRETRKNIGLYVFMDFTNECAFTYVDKGLNFTLEDYVDQVLYEYACNREGKSLKQIRIFYDGHEYKFAYKWKEFDGGKRLVPCMKLAVENKTVQSVTTGLPYYPGGEKIIDGYLKEKQNAEQDNMSKVMPADAVNDVVDNVANNVVVDAVIGAVVGHSPIYMHKGGLKMMKGIDFEKYGVKQRGLYDCGVAALATAAQITYKKAFELTRDPSLEFTRGMLGNDVRYAQLVKEIGHNDKLFFGINELEMSWALWELRIPHVSILNLEPVTLGWLNAAKDVMQYPDADYMANEIKNSGTGLIASRNDPAPISHWLVFSKGEIWDPYKGVLEKGSSKSVANEWKKGGLDMCILIGDKT